MDTAEIPVTILPVYKLSTIYKVCKLSADHHPVDSAESVVTEHRLVAGVLKNVNIATLMKVDKIRRKFSVGKTDWIKKVLTNVYHVH